MKRLILPILAALALVLPLPALAHEASVGALTIDHPWGRPNLPDRPAAAYMDIGNAGEAADRLVAARSPEFGRVELHRSIMEDGMMKMLPVEGIDIPAGGSAALAPGGYHAMLFEASARFAEGDSYPLTLVFEAAGEVTVEVSVSRRGAAADDGGMDHGGMDHGGMEMNSAE